VYLVNRGVQIATRPTWAFQEVLQKAVPSKGSNRTHLGELGSKVLPHFPINRGRREEQKCSTLLVVGPCGLNNLKRDRLRIQKKQQQSI